MKTPFVVNRIAVIHRRHAHGWIETPDGRRIQPATSRVQFVAGCDMPVLTRPRRRWFARLMGIFA